MVVATYAVLVAAVVAIAVAFPHAKLYNPWSQGEDPLPLVVGGLVALSVAADL